MTDCRRRHSPSEFEAEVIPGLESSAIAELRDRFGAYLADVRRLRSGFIRFRFSDRPQQLLRLRSVVAVYQVHLFLIPRPKALLGHQHLARLTKIMTHASQALARPPRTFGIGAAGSRSSVMRRLNQELAETLRLEPAHDEKGELFIRLLRSQDANCWEVLIRLSLRPLSARNYRLVNMPGALNATAAFAMSQVDALPERAAVVNLCSGTSTILIEHAQSHRQHQLLAIDCNAAALEAGRRNAGAAGLEHQVEHIQADARRAPLSAHMADRLYADLPFGHHIGSHDANTRLYPALLAEAARVAKPGAAFVVLTHEVKLLRRCLEQSPWSITSETRMNLRGLHPRLFVLRQNSARI